MSVCKFRQTTAIAGTAPELYGRKRLELVARLGLRGLLARVARRALKVTLAQQGLAALRVHQGLME